MGHIAPVIFMWGHDNENGPSQSTRTHTLNWQGTNKKANKNTISTDGNASHVMCRGDSLGKKKGDGDEHTRGGDSDCELA